MKHFNYKIAFIIAFSSCLVFLSCSTKKNKWTNRTYHNITAHYNAWFNGNESLKEGEKIISQNLKDNYLNVLPVFPDGTKEVAMSVSPQMDRASEKAAKVISKHSIYIKGVEYCSWIDDSYLMMGKAFYNKQEYETAQKSFNYILNSYKNSDVREEATIWLARSCVRLKEYTRAEVLLEDLRVKNKMNSNSTKIHFNMAYADLYITKQDYTPAIDYIQDAILLNPKRQVKTRLIYILGQLYQINGPLSGAYDQFAKIVKRNATYEMTFNARINMAKCYEGTGSVKKDFILKQLAKMIKESKNKEYLDQIYYTIAEIALKDEDEEEAIKNLEKSIVSSINNNYQKAASALKLADLFFARLDYSPAQQYYDTAMICLPKDYPNYLEIKNKTFVLTNLVQNLTIVKTQDSLQKLAKMPENERLAVIDNIISDYNKNERKRLQEEADRQLLLQTLTQNRDINNTQGQSGGWYFYNTTTLNFGYADFERKWGKRKLEDNWRRSIKELAFDDKTVVESDSLIDENDTSATKEEISKDPKNRKTYLQDIPLTPQSIAVSNEKIANALYNLGFIYKEGLSDITKSNESFKSLYDRFSEHKHILPSLYQLYLNYSEINNPQKAEEYKQLIISKFPNSDYAEILKDPSYYLKIQERQKAGEIFYTETYENYTNKLYDSVILKTYIAHNKFPKNIKLLAKFDYINAVSLGIKYGNDTLIIQLKNIIAKYSNSPVKELAQTLLNGLGDINKKTNINTDNNNTNISNDATLQYNENDFHFYIIIADIRKVNFNDLKIKLSDFNSQYFSLLSLQTNAMYIDDKNQMATVLKFENKTKAMDYYNFIKENKAVFEKINLDDIVQYVISDRNYPIFYKNKKLREAYPKFFEDNYILK